MAHPAQPVCDLPGKQVDARLLACEEIEWVRFVSPGQAAFEIRRAAQESPDKTILVTPCNCGCYDSPQKWGMLRAALAAEPRAAHFRGHPDDCRTVIVHGSDAVTWEWK